MQGELIDWAVPVVYARDPNMTLCAAAGRRVSVVPDHVDARRQAGAPPPAVRSRVAVWDIDDVFPSLDRTLER